MLWFLSDISTGTAPSVGVARTAVGGTSISDDDPAASTMLESVSDAMRGCSPVVESRARMGGPELSMDAAPQQLRQSDGASAHRPGGVGSASADAPSDGKTSDGGRGMVVEDVVTARDRTATDGTVPMFRRLTTNGGAGGTDQSIDLRSEPVVEPVSVLRGCGCASSGAVVVCRRRWVTLVPGAGRTLSCFTGGLYGCVRPFVALLQTNVDMFNNLKHALRFSASEQFRIAIGARRSNPAAKARAAALYASSRSERSSIGVEGGIVDTVCAVVVAMTQSVRRRKR